jgi:hypothetical protein
MNTKSVALLVLLGSMVVVSVAQTQIKDRLQFARKIGVRYPLAVATEDVKQRLGSIEGLPTTMTYD